MSPVRRVLYASENPAADNKKKSPPLLPANVTTVTSYGMENRSQATRAGAVAGHFGHARFYREGH